jgi:hypothetical protein
MNFMDDFGSSIVSGFFRGIGYLLADIFYGTICYWIGWPICKVFSGGKYPKKAQYAYWSESSKSGGWCSAIGLLILVAISIYFVSFRG